MSLISLTSISSNCSQYSYLSGFFGLRSSWPNLSPFDFEILMDIANDAGITTLPTSAAAIFSNPVNKKSYIKGIVIHNGHSSSEDVFIYRVPDNAGAVGTAATTNEIFNQTLSAGQDYYLEFPDRGLILEDENDTIQGKTDTVSVVTIQITGGQEST